MKNKILLDIDGCIVDMSRRWELRKSGAITTKEYNGLAMLMFDKPIETGVVLYKCLLRDPDLDCIFVTAREEVQRSGTHDMLMKIFFPDFPMNIQLLMRPDDEPYAQDTKLKILARNCIDPNEVLFAIDDDPDMNAAYHSVGIQTFMALPPNG